jgi:hypothetical protein
MNYPKVDRGHIVTAGYLRAWTINDLIAMCLIGQREGKPISVRDAGVRGPFYRRTRPDGTKSDDVEWSLSQGESRMLLSLREIENRWPLNETEKGVIGQFIGLHMVRGPAWYAWHREFRKDSFVRFREAEAARDAPDYEGVDRTEEWLATDTQEHIRMLSLAPKVGAVIGCMNWTLVRFPTPILATSDHPVVVWPDWEARRANNAPMTIKGVLTSLEVRFPISPQLALVATWLDLPDPEAPVIAGIRALASNLNTFTIGQAEKQWFHQPGAVTPRTAGRLVPLSSLIHPGYDASVAARSERRRATGELILPLLGRNFPEYIKLIYLTRPSIFEYRPATTRSG